MVYCLKQALACTATPADWIIRRMSWGRCSTKSQGSRRHASAGAAPWHSAAQQVVDAKTARLISASPGVNGTRVPGADRQGLISTLMRCKICEDDRNQYLLKGSGRGSNTPSYGRHARQDESSLQSVCCLGKRPTQPSYRNITRDATQHREMTKLLHQNGSSYSIKTTAGLTLPAGCV